MHGVAECEGESTNCTEKSTRLWWDTDLSNSKLASFHPFPPPQCKNTKKFKLKTRRGFDKAPPKVTYQKSVYNGVSLTSHQNKSTPIKELSRVEQIQKCSHNLIQPSAQPKRKSHEKKDCITCYGQAATFKTNFWAPCGVKSRRNLAHVQKRPTTYLKLLLQKQHHSRRWVIKGFC